MSRTLGLAFAAGALPAGTAVLVGIGGVLGALSRHLLGEWIDRGILDTLAVNVTGSFVLGGLLSAPLGESLLLVFATGFCGAFTTFSTFAVETVRLAETGNTRRALANALLTLVATLLAVAAGAALAGSLV